jgi:hypothetical protein
MIKICYIRLRKKINQLFCKHIYVTYTMRGTDLEITRCMKCGKIKSLKH